MGGTGRRKRPKFFPSGKRTPAETRNKLATGLIVGGGLLQESFDGGGTGMRRRPKTKSKLATGLVVEGLGVCILRLLSPPPRGMQMC